MRGKQATKGMLGEASMVVDECEVLYNTPGTRLWNQVRWHWCSAQCLSLFVPVGIICCGRASPGFHCQDARNRPTPTKPFRQ